MNIWTSYFGNYTKIPTCYYHVSIARSSPRWYRGPRYMKLAPSWDLLNKLKANVKEDIPLAIELYKDTYKKETLDKLNQDEVLNNLMIFSKGEDIVLLCYEAPDKFCHRHLVASWFEEVGIHVKELIN